MYLALYSFLRKFEKGDVELDEEDNIDGMLAEPMGPGITVSNKIALDADTREKILGRAVNAKKLNAVQ